MDEGVPLLRSYFPLDFDAEFLMLLSLLIMMCGEMVLRIGNRLQIIAIQPDFPSNLPSLVLIVTRTNIELIHAARGKPEHRRGPQVPPVNPDH